MFPITKEYYRKSVY